MYSDNEETSSRWNTHVAPRKTPNDALPTRHTHVEKAVLEGQRPRFVHRTTTGSVLRVGGRYSSRMHLNVEDSDDEDKADEEGQTSSRQSSIDNRKRLVVSKRSLIEQSDLQTDYNLFFRYINIYYILNSLFLSK